MIDLEFQFEESPWEAYLRSREPGDTAAAGALLAMLEGEEEDALEEAFRLMEVGSLVLSVSDLPRVNGTGEAALRLKREADLVKNGLNYHTLEETDPLRLYLEELGSIPACGDEAILSQDAAGGDQDARLMLTNLGLARVVQLAGEYTGFGVLLMDLIQEGSLGLWNAVSNYTSGDYAVYRDKWIRFALARAVTLQARSMGAGQRMRSALEDYRQVDERLLSELGRNPTLEEIALELHMTVEEAFSVKKTLDDARILAKQKAPEPEEEAREEEDQAVENTALFQMRQRILDLLSGLSEQDSELLTLRFGLEGGLPLSPEETGRKLGLTPEEVTAREAAALAQLRNS